MNQDGKQSKLKELTLCKNCARATQQMFLTEARWVHLKKGEFLFRTRDKVDQVYLLVSGFALLGRESGDHGVRRIFLESSGDLLNEVTLDYSGASVTCEALTDLDAVYFPRIIFLEMMRTDFRFNKMVVDSMAMKIRRLYHMIETSTKTTRLGHQVASRLWKFSRDYGVEKNGAIQLPFEVRITMLAGFVGSNRETVSKIIKKMTEEGILSIQKGVCTIYNTDALKNFE